MRVVMTGHLLVPAYDKQHPATLSRTLINDLLRQELGFDGLVVTDGIEMGAVADRYGIDGATVGAVAAGADAVCVGGERADEATVELLSGALLSAVASGELTEDRLREAAERVQAFAAWSAALGRGVPISAIRGDIGFEAARRAMRLSGPADELLPIRSAPHVVELVPATNLAIGPETPWGVAAPLRERLPGTTFARLHPEQLGARAAVLDELALKPATGRPLVVVVRDASRHDWMSAALTELLRARPDAVVVEMGLPGNEAPGAVHIVTHGATTASGVAAAEALIGARR